MRKAYRVLIILIIVLLAAGGFLAFRKYQNDKLQSEKEEEIARAIKSEEELYNAALSQFNEYKSEIVLETADSKHASDIIQKVIYEHPELFWINTTRYETTSDGKKATTTFELSGTAQEIESQKNTFDQKIGEIISQINPSAGDYDKAKFVHNYIINNTTYDAAMLDAKESTYNAGNTAYGVLVNGKGICTGYSYAFELLMQKIGIECFYVTGDDIKHIDEEIGHSWNIVKLDGEYYNIDVTWDDPKTEGGEILSYRYFGLTNEEIKTDHKFDDESAFPICTATANNYYIKEGFYFETYNFDQIKKAVSNMNSTEAIFLRFGSANEADKARADLIDNKTANNIPKIKVAIDSGRKLSYTVDESYLTFYLK